MLISVVTPVYNTAPYLDACLRSILAQEMADFELLLIDDGSTDDSGAICDRYAAQDSRVRVFHIPNGGVSAARNLGLDHACGEFVVFVDSDDYIHPNHLSQFATAGIGEGGVAFSNIIAERRAAEAVTLQIPDCRVTTSEACMEIFAALLRKGHFGWSANKIFSRATIERYGLRFDTSRSYCEDEVFTAQYCVHATHLVGNSNPTYFYREVATSLLHTQTAPRIQLDAMLHLTDMYSLLGYSDEALYQLSFLQFRMIRNLLRRHISADDNVMVAAAAQALIQTWERLCKYRRAVPRKEFYDRKLAVIGWLACAPRSVRWIRMVFMGIKL